MGLLAAVRTVVLLIGAGFVAYGGYVLATGRVPARSRAVYRSTRDAGLHALCGGLSLVFLALGQLASHADALVLSLGATALALVFIGLAVFRYRPRRPSTGS